MADLSGYYTDLLEETAFATRAPLGIIIPPTVPPPPVVFDPPSPADEAQDYLVQASSRVLTQYRASTKLLAEIEVLVGIVQEIENALIDVKGLDDYLDVAVTGVNLDVTGEIVGQARMLSNGSDVTDTLYRTLITARIARNQAEATNPQLLLAIATITAATIVYRDLGQMGVAYQMPRAPTSDEVAILTSDLLPRAMGVEINPSQYTDSTHNFGWDDDAGAVGWNEVGDAFTGNWSEVF